MVKIWSVMLVMAVALWGCSSEQDHKGKTPLVEVAGNFLYLEDLRASLPVSLTKDDSVVFAEHYIKNWVEDALLFEKAEDNIPDNEKITRLVDNYRRALIMHTYQEELIGQQLSGEISAEDIQTYYDANKKLFTADQPFVKGLFIKVPLRSPQMASVRSWCRKSNRDAIEQLEKYSLRHAVSYEYFFDRWEPVADLAAKIPLGALHTDEAYLNQHHDVEVRDTAYCYFLHVEEFLGKGKELPLDYAQEEIKEILINLKRVEFINSVKDELYERASERNRINYFYLQSE